jgi:hypothetical protein
MTPSAERQLNNACGDSELLRDLLVTLALAVENSDPLVSLRVVSGNPSVMKPLLVATLKTGFDTGEVDKQMSVFRTEFVRNARLLHYETSGRGFL